MKQQNLTSSLWQEVSLPSYPSLKGNENTDVCIIGAGIVGLTAAYLLSKEGKRVIVVDKDSVGSGQSCRTSGHLCSIHDERYSELKKLFPNDLKTIAESQLAALDLIEKIIKEEKIDCDFKHVDGYLILHENDNLETLQKELEILNQLNLVDVAMVPKAPFTSFDSGPCLRFSSQGEFHILKYLKGLAEAITRLGGVIYNNTKVTEFFTKKNIRVVTQAGYTIRAKSLIVATNTPINDRLTMHTKQAPYRTYVVGSFIPKDSVPNILCWDTGDPYHYIRVFNYSKTKDVLLVGGEDHKTGQEEHPSKIFNKLEKWAKKRFPMFENNDFAWSGQILEPVDSLAFIGRNPLDNPNVYIATGDSGNGLTHAAIAGMILTDLILKRRNPWEKLFSPSRITLRSADEFARENLNVAFQYTKWLSPSVTESEKTVDKIPEGSGCIVQKGLCKHAVYKDEEGNVHQLSAVCPHLGGLVQWNDAEKTWDCPCHGSRFDRFGKQIDGPAISDLRFLH